MHATTLVDIVRRESIPDNQAIFHFRKENGKGVIEFDLPPEKKTKVPMTPEEALKRLEALQFKAGRPTNSVKIIRKLRQPRYPRRKKVGLAKRR